MIVVSLLLILVSGGLLATGILQANDPFVMASIGVSVLAAAALFLGIRQQRGDVGRTVGQDADTPGGVGHRTTAAPAASRTPPASAGRVTPAAAAPAGGARQVRAVATPTASMPAGSPPAASRPAASGAAPSVPAPSGAPPARPAVGSVPVGSGPIGDASAATAPPVADEVTETQVIDLDAVAQAGVEPGDAAGRDGATAPDAVSTEVPGSSPAGETGEPTGEPTAAHDATPAAEPVEPGETGEPGELDDEEDPPDEPAAELLMASEVSRLAERDNEVLVVDGRPRYHLAGCPHLADKESQPLPVSEAVELGFNACSLCGAATAILAEATAT